MIVKRMRATFGPLERAELVLGDGLNVICAPNESGKSSWCAFLRAMLYGVPTRERDRKGYLAEKNRFQPWSGAPMEGEVELVWRGRAITLRRASRGGAPMADFEAVETDTGLPVPELDGATCGQTLLGVGREVWERSAFLGQAPTLTIDGTPELERRIQSLLSSGQEDVSFTDTENTLKKWRNARRHNRTGAIPRLEEKLAGLDETLAKVRDAAARAAEAQTRRTALEGEQAAAEADLAAHDALERRDLDRRYTEAVKQERAQRERVEAVKRQREAEFNYLPTRGALRDAREDFIRWRTRREEWTQMRDAAVRAREKADRAEAEARDDRFDGLDGEAAEARARRDAEECRLLDGKKTSCKKKKTAGFLLAAAGLALGGAAWLAQWLSLPAAGAAGGALAALGLILALVFRGKAAGAGRERAALLARYRVSAPEQMEAEARAYRKRTDEAAYDRRAAGEQEKMCGQWEKELADTEKELTDFVGGFARGAADMTRAEAAVERALELAAQLDDAQEKVSGLAQRCDDLRAQGAREATETEPPVPAPQRTRQQAQQALDDARAGLAQAVREQSLAEGELTNLGDPAQMEARRAQTADELERRGREYEALTVALEELERAHGEMQRRFAPELNRLAGEILSDLTGGRYAGVSLDRDFEASARRQGDLLPHSASELSRGASDQLYLAVRLAVCRLCLPEDEPSPLVLDDALLAFDDERMLLALRHLAACGRQILLFSCQKREGEAGLGAIQYLQS